MFLAINWHYFIRCCKYFSIDFNFYFHLGM